MAPVSIPNVLLFRCDERNDWSRDNSAGTTDNRGFGKEAVFMIISLLGAEGVSLRDGSIPAATEFPGLYPGVPNST